MSLTRAALVEYLADSAGADMEGVEDTTPLFSSGMVDSFAMVDLLMFLEKHTGTKLGPEDIDLDNLDTLERILAFAAQRKQGG